MPMYMEVPISEATEPTTGKKWVDQYWLIRNDSILFYNGTLSDLSSPQCNSDKRVVDMLLPENCTSKKISAVYAKSCQRYFEIIRKLSN